MGANSHGLQGGRLLGAPQQVALTEIQVTPLLYVDVQDGIGPITTTGKLLRVIDPLSSRAVFSPITPQGARNLIEKLTPLASDEPAQGGSDGDTAVYE